MTWALDVGAATTVIAVLTGCAGEFNKPATQTRFSTVTMIPAPTSANTPAFYRGPIRGDGVFAVAESISSSTDVDGRIPPGRYRAEVAQEAQKGSWIRCRSLPCGPDEPDAAIVTTTLTGPGSSNILDIDANDVAVWLSGVNLTPIG